MNTKEDVYRILGSSNHSLSDRAADDFYSTPKEAVEAMLGWCSANNVVLPNTIIEPSVGSGSIASVLMSLGHNVCGFDIVDRGFPNTMVCDWLSVYSLPSEEVAIVANFPYKVIQQHTEHSMNLLRDGEYLIQLAKIQFLEGKARRNMFEQFPPKYVLVFSQRIKCLANGKDTIGSSAICFCWYIFQKGFKGLPQIDWL